MNLPDKLNSQDNRFRFAVGALGIFALVCLVYYPILPGSFLMDDQRLVHEENPLVTGELGLRSIWFQTDFPLSTLAFWAQWRAWGNSPGGYHAVNMALHALSAVLLWRVLARLKISGAWLAGAIFAVHPVCVATVARIAELKNTLSLPFFLASILFYVCYENPTLQPARHNDLLNPPQRGHASFWYGLSLAAFVLALLAKTSTVMLPVVLLCGAASQRWRITRQDWLRTGPFFLLALAFGLMSAWFQKHQALAGQALAPESFWQRLAIAGRVFWFYVGKALLPVRLNLVYPQWKMETISPVSFVPVLLGCAALVICWRFRRGWGRPALLALAVFAVTLFPALGFLDSQFLTHWQVSDHLQYLSLIAPAALAAAALAALPGAWVFRGVATVVVLTLSVLSFQRAEVFAAPESLFVDTLAKNPSAWAAQNDLGVILASRTNYPEAAAHFTASLNANPDNADAHANLAQILAAQGKFADADPQFQAALKIKPSDAVTQKNFATALAQRGKFREALSHLRAALLWKPDAQTRQDYAMMLYQTGDFRQAADQFRQVLASQPDSVEALNNLAWLLATCWDARVRNGAEAVRCAERASRLPPVKGMCVPGTLAAAYAEAGRFPEAVATAEQAMKSETANGETQFAEMNRQLLTLYRASKPFHDPPPRRPNQYSVGDPPH